MPFTLVAFVSIQRAKIICPRQCVCSSLVCSLVVFCGCVCLLLYYPSLPAHISWWSDKFLPRLWLQSIYISKMCLLTAKYLEMLTYHYWRKCWFMWDQLRDKFCAVRKWKYGEVCVGVPYIHAMYSIHITTHMFSVLLPTNYRKQRK
jgi:hypothetical protein